MGHKLAKREDELVAFHEAGHVVVALELGQRIIGVSVDGAGGNVRFDLDGILADSDEFLRRSIRICLAGMFASARRTSIIGERPLEQVGGSMDDYIKADTLAGMVGDRFAETDAAEADVLRLFHDPCVWAKVERVAAALLERRTLTGEQVAAIIAGST